MRAAKFLGAMTLVAARRPSTSALLRQLIADRPLVQITALAEREWRLRRHGLCAPGDRVDLVDLARAHCGLHAARQLTPWVTLHTRDPAATPGLLRAAVTQRQLLRLRCMRRTLHLVPPDLASVVHVATLPQRVRPCELALVRWGASRRSVSTLRRSAVQLVSGRELGYRELESELLAAAPASIRRRPDAIVVARLVIKLMWEEGELLVGDTSPSLHHEHRTFALTSEATPTLSLDCLTASEAIIRLLRAYLEGYGPAHVADFQWWSGLGLAEAMPAWLSIEDELVRVRVDERPGEELVALGTTVDQLAAAGSRPSQAAPARLLAYEDPALKGYFRSRWRYVDPAQQQRLFNSIGEARASVLLGGRVAAVWHWNRRTQAPELECLRRLSRAESGQVGRSLAAVAAFLRGEPLLAGRTGTEVASKRASALAAAV